MTNKKFVCIKATGCEFTNENNLVVCSMEGERSDIHENELSQVCDNVSIISKNIDMVEVITPKGKLKTEHKSNAEEDLQIKIK